MVYWKTLHTRMHDSLQISMAHFSDFYKPSVKFPHGTAFATAFVSTGQIMRRIEAGGSDKRDRGLELRDSQVQYKPLDLIHHKGAEVHKPLFVAPTASVSGSVIIEEGCSFGWGSCVRNQSGGKVGIGRNTHIGDTAVVRTPMKHNISTLIGENVVIGQGALVEAATVDDGAVIGAGAVIMPGCVVGKGAYILPQTVLTQKTIVPPFSVWGGRPGRYLRDVTVDEVGVELEEVSELAAAYKDEMMDQIPMTDGKALYKLALENGHTQGRRRVFEIADSNVRTQDVWVDFSDDWHAFVQESRHPQV
eukprot:TRINITY_DN67384_c7_g1_i1.p1 TRINITY_DN67384_c7_g1~~TRINITY_DN67384_c7_g1_i1.p1  ORF type:complete len:305 (-),score=28.38 TRINITY_DN67384_c7_g1_i1:137-1051(-)